MDLNAALHELFGFRDFRPGQRAACEAAVAGRDALVVMPTGSGKSLCYQLPALMRADLTLVVSPLVSLMQDQVEALERRAPGRVALVNGQQEASANARALARAVQLRGDQADATGRDAPETGDLVGHQRDQGADDDGEVRAHQRGQLVADRLARAGGHDHEHVAPGDRGGAGLALPGTELAEAEIPL